MARGFYTTLGAGSTDAIDTGFSNHATLRSYWVRCYVNGSGAGTGPRLWDKRVSGSQVDICYFNPSISQIMLERAGGVWALTPATAGGTFSLLITLDTGSLANTPKCWVNGVSQTVGVSSAMSGITTNADNYVIGNRLNDSARPFDGLIEEFAIWDGVLLGDAEAQQLHGGKSPLYLAKNLACYYPLEDGKPPRDLSPAGTRPRRIVGTKTWPHLQKVVYPHRWPLATIRGAQATAAGGTVTGVGASDGAGVATGVGAATAAAVAASAGTGEALGVGAFTLAATEGVANAVGTGTAAGVGAATAAAIASAAGLGEALGVGASIGIISAVGNAAGSSEALGYSPQLLGGGESGRPGLAGRKRRKRIEWLPPDVDIETGERLPPPEAVAPIQLSKGERKVARLVAQYRGRDDDVAERARESLEALHLAQNSELARFIARQQALDEQRRGLAAAAAEDDEAAIAFMQWLLRQP